MKVSKKTNIIIADESLKYAESLAKVLELEGYDITGVVSSAKDVFVLLKNHKPDILIYDFFLSPDFIKLKQTLNEIRSISPDTKILVLSSDDYFELENLCMTNGAVGYCEKSIEVRLILETLAKIIKNDKSIIGTRQIV